jgi:hypothetical protein
VAVSIVKNTAIDRMIIKNLFLKIFTRYYPFSTFFHFFLNVFNIPFHSLWKTFSIVEKTVENNLEDQIFQVAKRNIIATPQCGK